MENVLSDMKAECNSIDVIKEKYKRGIIESYMYVIKNAQSIIAGRYDKAQRCREVFDQRQVPACEDLSLGSNSRWGIVSKKNLFGLEGVLFPDEKETGETRSAGNRFYLKANARKVSISEIQCFILYKIYKYI